MIFGDINQPADLHTLRLHPVWDQAFCWIERHAASHPEGVVELRQKLMYINVHGYPTKARGDCRYESHRNYVDLQYCIAGGELVEWEPLPGLRAKDEYDPGKDVIHHHTPEQPGATIRMVPGRFAIFHPWDGHMPKIADSRHARVAKLVIKIDRTLLV